MMNKLFLLQASLLVQIGLAAKKNESSLLTVMQPTSLALDTVNIEASLGNFGHITYGQTIVGRVLRPSSYNNYGCAPLSDDQFENPVDRSPNLALFIMVERGYCPNPQKVRNIENFGAAVALIADNKAEDMDDLVMVDFGGNGHSLVTPGFMVDYDSATKIKETLTEGKEVVMRASLNIAN